MSERPCSTSSAAWTPSPSPVRPNRQLTDREVVDALAGGDDGALDELLARYSGRLQSYLDRILWDGTWTDDLLQEVFVRVYQHAASYDREWSVAVWIFAIARNLAVDLMRREGRRRRRLTGFAGAATQPSVQPSAQSVVEGQEFLELLDQALAVMPEIYGSVFLLREREGLAYEEIAAVLGISTKTVSSRLHRARTRLQQMLSGYFE